MRSVSVQIKRAVICLGSAALWRATRLSRPSAAKTSGAGSISGRVAQAPSSNRAASPNRLIILLINVVAPDIKKSGQSV
jgi:hypothetical protein